jgi:hypothetical protein
MLFALLLLPRQINNAAKPGFAHQDVSLFLHLDKFLAPRQLVPRSLRQCPFSSFLHLEKFSAIYQTCTATAPSRNKNCTRTAKSTPYLSCHRDNFVAKVPGPVAGWPRQVTQPPFIAGPSDCLKTYCIC